MRNIVVHQYGKIDYSLLFEGLCTLQKDFLEFQYQILEWVKKQEES